MRTRAASNGKGGSQSAIDFSSVMPATSGTNSRATAAPSIAATPAIRSRATCSTTRPWSVSAAKNRRSSESPTATGRPCAARSSAIQRSITISSAAGGGSGRPSAPTSGPTGGLVVSRPTTVE